MSESSLYDMVDSEIEGRDEQKTYRRRLGTYSQTALARGLPADRIFVRHPAFVHALEAFDRVYQLSKATQVPQGTLLVAPTGLGKTSLIKYYLDTMPPSKMFEEQTGALAVRLQERPNVGRLISTLLRLLRYPFANVTKTTISLKKDILVDALRQKGTRMLFVDEAQQLLHGLGRRHVLEVHSEMTEFLRELMDDCGLGLILCGTLALDGVHDAESHLSARVTGRVELQNFEGVQFLAFLKAFAKQCNTFPLANTDFAAAEEAWMAACGGNPRATKRLLIEGILVAVDAKRDVLDAATMARAFERIAGVDSLAANPFKTLA